MEDLGQVSAIRAILRGASFLAGAFLLALFCGGAVPAPAQKASPSHKSAAAGVQAGKKIFSTTCAACHGLDGRGGEHAPDIAGSPDVQQMTDTQIFRMVHNGSDSGAMPAFGSTFSSEQINSIVAYLRVLQGAQGAEKLPGDPDAGKTLFYGAAGCSECHMVEGQGGFIGPDLSSYAATHTVDEMRTAITDPNRNLDPRQMPVTVTTKDGKTYSGIPRNQDNFSLQLQSLDGAFHLFQMSDVAHVEHSSHSLMPADYSQKFSAAQINSLISFLMRTAPHAPQESKEPRGSY